MPSPDKLEREADEILRKDAEAKGFIKNTYGLGAYLRKYGILSKHQRVTIRIMERPGEIDRLQQREDRD